MRQSIGLYWYTCDLRVQDNNLLNQAATEVDALLCCYCLPQWNAFIRHFSQQRAFALQKQAFLMESLNALSESLATFNQALIICSGQAEEVLSRFIARYGITHLYCDRFAGINEQRVVERIAERYPQLTVVQQSVRTLFNDQRIPFELNDLPQSFTQFRKKVDQLPVGVDFGIEVLPKPIDADLQDEPLVEDIPACIWFEGGEAAGIRHCQRYFSSSLASQYKQTRNGLDGRDSSTKFSPWLALGCVSPKRVASYLAQYERDHGANESTGWIYFELLWREYFYWYGRRYGAKLFRFSGLGDVAPLTSFYSSRFLMWTNGNTPFSIVNACMKQLNQTGYLSNRGRQLAASCLIHELNIDWRYGAAYFESQLIDYDVASNWGNWQYLAGVGSDQRGSRRFDLEKQAELYDPQGQFTQRWNGEKTVNVCHSIDSVDMVDWPLSKEINDE
ncbi:DASH family cryptochrome [Vibrio ostreicida]|uniref:DASH family cryptochrome n=1 Tax=Vibrio ostreicida TaxID=526588 RepID=UPI003B5C775F